MTGTSVVAWFVRRGAEQRQVSQMTDDVKREKPKRHQMPKEMQV